MVSERIAVTGVGCVSPAGPDASATFEAILQGRSFGRAMDFDTRGGPPAVGAPVTELPPGRIGEKAMRRMDRGAALAVMAATEAWEQAAVTGVPTERIGVVVGTAGGGLSSWERFQPGWAGKGYSTLSPFLAPMVMSNSATAEITLALGVHGPSWTVTGACAAGSYGVIEGYRLLREGAADVVVVAGTDALLTPTIYAVFAKMGATTRNTDFQRASRPFDVARDGFVLGEGSGALVLETVRHAEERGAEVLAEVAGYGVTTDAFHIVAPDPQASGATRAMQMAMSSARLAPEDVGHVNAHGTSTTLNDLAESVAMRACFGESGPLVTSCKGSIGHLLGGAGAVELVVTVLSVRSGLVPPIANTETIDPELCYSSMQIGEARQIVPKPAIKNSFAFGGHNASVAIVPPNW